MQNAVDWTMQLKHVNSAACKGSLSQFSCVLAVYIQHVNMVTCLSSWDRSNLIEAGNNLGFLEHMVQSWGSCLLPSAC